MNDIFTKYLQRFWRKIVCGKSKFIGKLALNKLLLIIAQRKNNSYSISVLSLETIICEKKWKKEASFVSVFLRSFSFWINFLSASNFETIGLTCQILSHCFKRCHFRTWKFKNLSELNLNYFEQKQILTRTLPSENQFQNQKTPQKPTFLLFVVY